MMLQIEKKINDNLYWPKIWWNLKKVRNDYGIYNGKSQF